MLRPWVPGEPGDDELDSLFAQDRGAWRGDLHRDDESWRGGGEHGDAGDDAWRGAEHVADWPEDAAGPEYWMYKRDAEGSEED
jgi:hypothetical protein